MEHKTGSFAYSYFMGDLTENFSAWEFRCHCGNVKCGPMQILDPDFVEVLQMLRNDFKRPINILSGYRCPLHSLSLARPRSTHTLGIAADIVVAGTTPVHAAMHIYENFFPEDIGGLGINWEKGTIHVDARALENAVIWRYRRGRAETIRTNAQAALLNMKLLETASYG